MSVHVEVSRHSIRSHEHEHDADDTESFEGHLDTCPTCPAELEWLAQVVRLMTTATWAETVLPEAS